MLLNNIFIFVPEDCIQDCMGSEDTKTDTDVLECIDVLLSNDIKIIHGAYLSFLIHQDHLEHGRMVRLEDFL